MKRKLSLILALILLFSHLSFSVSASSNDEQDFLDSVSSIMHNYHNDKDAAIAALHEIEAYLVDEPVTETYTINRNNRSLYPTDYTLTIYCTRRGTTGTTYYFMWELDTDEGRIENSPGPLDFVSIEWDTDYASYYSATADNVVTTVNSRNTGIVLFNVEDAHFDSADYAYGSVRVTRLKTDDTIFGSKFIHTFTDYNYTGSASYAYGSSANIAATNGGSLNLEHTKSYTVTVDSQTSQWQRWVDKWTHW